MKKHNFKQNTTDFELLIKELEDMDIKTPVKITDIDFNQEKKSLTLTYCNGSKRGYIGNIAIKVMQTFKKYEK
ncbi:MAG: hypothetical protein L3J56_06330 [Bacteroidales bacterium]|nr:hypothetical protein [Bacteroidales bacterium]